MASEIMDILWAPLLAGLGVFVGWWLRHLSEGSVTRSTSKSVNETSVAHGEMRNCHTDSLTGLSCRAPFVADVQRRVAEFKRGAAPVSVLLMRIDRFDDMIDQRGLQGSNEVLVAVSRFLRGMIRDMDHVSRYSDSVFGIVLPGASEKIAKVVAKRLTQAVSSCRLPATNAEVSISASLGAAQAKENESAEELLARAENALDGDSSNPCQVGCTTAAD